MPVVGGIDGVIIALLPIQLSMANSGMIWTRENFPVVMTLISDTDMAGSG